MACDINTIVQLQESLLAQGYSKDQVKTFIELFKLKNSENSSVIDNILEKRNKLQPLSSTERTNLRRILGVFNERIETTIGSIEESTKTFDELIESLLSPEDRQSLTEYLKKLNIANGKLPGIGNDYIAALEAAIKTQRALNNEAFAQELEQDLIKEKERIAKLQSAVSNKQTEKNQILTKIQNLRKMAELTTTIAEGSLTDIETEAAKTISEAKNKVTEKELKIVTLKQRLEGLKQELKNIQKSKEPKRYQNTKDKIKNTKELITKAKEELKLAKQEFAKVVQEYVTKGVIDKDGKLKDISPTLKQFLQKLEKSEQRQRQNLSKLGRTEFIRSSREVSKSLKIKLAKETKALREIREGYKQRLGLINEYTSGLEKRGLNVNGVGIDLAFMTMLVGPTAVQQYLHNERPKLKETDDSGSSVDMSNLKPQEAIRILKGWRGRMLNSIHNGYYSQDLSVLNSENLTYMQAIANNTQVVDLTNPHLFDMVIAPDMLPEQALQIQTLGQVPNQNKAKTSIELSTWIESTRNTLLSLKSAEGFNKTIPESILRMALHQKLFDLAPTAFASALQQTAKRRNLTSGTFDEIAGIKSILTTLGVANVNELPEFKNPKWANDFTKLVAFDIETDSTDPTEIRSLQVETYENGKRVKKLYVNFNGTLTNSLEKDTVVRDPITKDQIEQVLNDLEMLQNQGFKVLTHNGNSFDFKHLHKFGVNTDLLLRVSLRSIDLLRNLGFDNTKMDGVGNFPKQVPGGSGLKALATNNLPPKAETAYGGRVTFKNGAVLYTTQKAYTDSSGVVNPEVQEELVGKEDIQKYWEEGQNTGDWTKFDAYAQNDTMLTIDLALRFAENDSTDVKLEYKEKPYTITTFKPRSNLFLAMSPISDNRLTFSDITKPLLELNPDLNSEATGINYTYELEYNLDKVIEVLDNWLIQAWAINPENKPKLDLLLSSLKTQKEKTDLSNSLVIKIANGNRAVLKALLKEKFKEYGYVQSLNSENDQLHYSVFKVDRENNTTTLDRENLYLTHSNEYEYEQDVYLSMVSFLEQNNIKGFKTRLKNQFNVREQMPNESDIEYFKNIIPDLIKKYIPEFTRISDFGNGNLDWKPSYDVGIAVIQVLLDQKPGVIQIDNILVSGENVVSTMLLQGTSSVYSGRSKNFIIPSRTDVNFASPMGIIEEEKAYDNFRLLNRVKFILTQDIPMDQIKDFLKYYDPDADPTVPISYFVNAQVNTIFPQIRDRTPFSNLKTLEERKITSMEFMFNIPRLLACFNHDCIYTGLNAGGRFLSDELPVYYKQDYISAGAPTAVATLAGAIDQVAWLTNFDFLDKEGEEEILRSLTRARKILSAFANPQEMIQQTNKSDYRYSGLHITTAAHHFYQESSFASINNFLVSLGLSEIIEQEEIVPAKGLRDPRYKAIDLLAEDLANLKADRTIYKDKYRLSDLEMQHLETVVNKLQSNRDNAKEFLKGAVTPRFYSAGFKGIFEGLMKRNKDNNLGFTTAEIKTITKVMLRQLMTSHLTLIDQALGLSQKQVDEVKKIFLTAFKPKVSRETMQNAFSQDFFGEQSYENRLKQMQSYFKQYVNLVAEQITPKMPDRAAKLEEVKKAMTKAYSGKLTEAAKLFNKKDFSTLTQDEKNTLVEQVNQVLAGSLKAYEDPKSGKTVFIKGDSNGYEKHLILWALNRRAATPYKLLDDNLELQKLVTGVHIDPKDYEGYIGRTIFHTYGLEIASGRNHMFGNWGNGPESSKLAQVRVEGGKEENKLGIWDIVEMDTSPEYWEKTFYQQVLMDLAPYYLPPTYNRETESREAYWKTNEERSIKELEAQGFANYVVALAARDPEARIGDYTAKQIVEKMEKYSGTPEQRFRLRTLASELGNQNNLISMDPSVDGLGSYRPKLADHDFSQRSIFALVEMQHAIRSERTRESQLIKTIENIQNNTTPPEVNAIIPTEHRGYVSIYNKDNLPFIPQQTSDTLTSLITGPMDPATQRAIRIKNQVTAFAKVFGWDELLENKDWTRLYLLQQLRSKAYIPTLQIFENSNDTDLNISVRAKAEFFDGFFKTLGTRTKMFLKNKNYSTIDLMLRDDEIGVSIGDIIAMRLKKMAINTDNNLKGSNVVIDPEAISWFSVLTYFGDKIDRLKPIKVGLVLDPGIVVRGERGLVENPTRSQPINIFGLEVRQIYKWILASEAFRRTATDYLTDHHPDILEDLQKKGFVDSNGFVRLEGIPLDEGLTEKIAKEAIRNTRELAIELNSKFTFLGIDDTVHMIDKPGAKALLERATTQTGPLATQARGDIFTITNTAVNNPGTLWAFTDDMLVQLLNSLANNPFIENIELAYQTGKDIGTVRTDLDKLAAEEERQLFERMSGLEEETFEALTILHKIDADANSTKSLVIKDYRNTDKNGQPRLTVDIPAYFTDPFKITVNNKIYYTTLEDSVFITDLLQVSKLANNLGMDVEAKQITDFLETQLIASKPIVETDPDSIYNQTSQPLLKLVALLSKAENSISTTSRVKQMQLVDFVQPGLLPDGKVKLLEEALKIVRVMQKVTGTNAQENNQYYYMASAHFDRNETITEDITINKSFVSDLIVKAGKKQNEEETKKALQGIKKAYKDFSTMPKAIDVSTPSTKFTTDITQFSDKDKFIDAFGNSGENIVNQLQGMVKQGLISQRTMDMKLIMIGSLALQNRNILQDLNLETRDDLGPNEFAIASKKNNKYSIGLNINAMKVTPENEILLKFAEELVHIARIKYMDINNVDYKKILGAFTTKRAVPMIREMLMAMNLNKPYNLLENDVKYATKNVEEFLAHYGAMILLQQTVYSSDVLTHLEAKYEAVNAARVWWNRAFYNIKYIASRAHAKFTQLQNDAYYGEVYNAANEVIQNLLFTGVPSGRIDVGNSDMYFNAFASFSTTEQNLTQTQKDNVRSLVQQQLHLEQQLTNPGLTTDIRTNLERTRDEISTRLKDPTINPKSYMGMHESQIQQELIQVVRVDGRIIQRRKPDLSTRALFAEGLNNWSIARGKRVDNKDTIAGLIRQLPDESDRVTRTIQNFLLQGFNQTNLSYNSPEALVVMISDLIDNWTVTTQSTYMPSSTSGGFMANKMALDGYMGNLRHQTSVVARSFTNLDARERINMNVARQLHGLPLTVTDPLEIAAVDNISKAFMLMHSRLGEEMVNGRIKQPGSIRHLDKVGLKLKNSENLSKEERDKGFTAIANLMKRKTLKRLDADGVNAVVSPYIAYLGGLIPTPDTSIQSQPEFQNAYEKFTYDPNAIADNATEALMKAMVKRAIQSYMTKNDIKEFALGASQFARTITKADDRIQEEFLKFIYRTRQHETTFVEALGELTNEEREMVVREYREIVKNNASSFTTGNKLNILIDSDFGFYMGESQYTVGFKPEGRPMDALVYEFFGKLGATAYLFDTRSPFLTNQDIYLNNDPDSVDDLELAQGMFDGDIDSIGLSLLRGVGYDAIQRVLSEQAFGIQGFNFTVQQIIDMARGLIRSRNPSTNIYGITNLDGRTNQNDLDSLLMASLDRLENANKDARGTLGNRSSFNPVMDTLMRGGRAITQLTFGPNIPLATWAVEGSMGAIGGALRGNNPIKFLLDAIDQNVGSFVVNTVGDIVRVRNGKVGLFNVDPPKVRGIAQNCLWLFEEIYSPMLPGKLTSDGLSSEMIDRMSSWERFLAWNSRSTSAAMKAIRVASENQANRRIAKDIQNRNLYRLRDSVNKILRNNRNPSNAVLREVIKDSGVKYNVEVLLAFIRAGLFETIETKTTGGSTVKTGVLETIEYLMSTNKLDRGTVPMMSFFNLEYDLRTTSAVFDKNQITQFAVQSARTAMMKAMKSYANMAMVINHPLDGTASATAHHAVLNFYKSYPGLYTAQFLMRRGSITPSMQFAFELLVYSIADTAYNIILSLASGYYNYEKLKRALEKRELNYRETLRLLMKYPLFSNNLFGFGLQATIQAFTGGSQDKIIGSIAENAIGYDIRNFIRALQSWSAYISGDIPKDHPMMATYNAMGRLFPVLSNTLVKMLLMQSFGDISSSGRRTGSRSRSSYILDKIGAVSDDSIREKAVRGIFKDSEYNPVDKRTFDGQYRQSKIYDPIFNTAVEKAKEQAVPKETRQPQVKQPKVPQNKQPSIEEQGTTPYAPPEEAFE